jgi:hypothetical protein
MVGEGVDLDAVNLVPGEGSRQGINRDVLRLDVACGFVKLPIEVRRLNLPGSAIGRAKRGVLT